MAAIETVFKLINEWQPELLATELKYRDSLVVFLRERMKDAKVETEYRHNGTTADVYVKQLHALQPKKNKILVVLCGETNPALVTRFKELFEELLLTMFDLQMGLVVKERGKGATSRQVESGPKGFFFGYGILCREAGRRISLEESRFGQPHPNRFRWLCTSHHPVGARDGVGVGKTPAVAYQRQHNSTCHLRLCAAATLRLQENLDLGGKGFLHCLIFIRRDAFHVFLYCRCIDPSLRSGFRHAAQTPRKRLNFAATVQLARRLCRLRPTPRSALRYGA